MGKVKNWTVEKKDEIESILIGMWASLGMDIPNNYEDIVQDCYEDVCETADPMEWHSGDVAIAFRRWVEAQANDNVQPVTDFEPAMEDKFTEIDLAMSEPHIGLDGIYGVKLNTVGDLRNAMSELNDEDQLVLATCDEHGDEQDHYPMYLDVYDGIILTDGSEINEVRFCQMPNSKPDIQDKQPETDFEPAMEDKFTETAPMSEKDKQAQWVCTECGGTNVQLKSWVNPNTKEIDYSETESEDCWCEDCQQHYPIKLK